LTPLPSSYVRVEFDGIFQHQNIVWDLSLYTLQRYYQNNALPGGHSHRVRQCMVIDHPITQNLPITVALALSIIDDPVVQKTVLMIRNYKNLRVGTHTWGDAIVID
jgi:hypothetical protein